MQPVPKRPRTRLQRDEDLMARYRELKKSGFHHVPKPVSPPPTVIISDDDDDDYSEGEKIASFVVVNKEEEILGEEKEEISVISDIDQSEGSGGEESSVSSDQSEGSGGEEFSVSSDQSEGVSSDQSEGSEGEESDSSFEIKKAKSPSQKMEKCVIADSDSDSDDADMDEDEGGVNRVGKRRRTDDNEYEGGRVEKEIDEEKEEGCTSKDDQRRQVKKEMVDYVVDDGGVKVDDQRCEGKEMIDEEEESGGRKEVRKRGKGRKGPLSANEIHSVLYDSIMGVKEGTFEGSGSVDETEDSRESADVDIERSDDEITWMYKTMFFSLACATDSDSADSYTDEEDTFSDTAKSQEQLCKEGKHCLVLDEEIGRICKSCRKVLEEIKNVTYPFHHNLYGSPERRYYLSNDYREAGDLHNLEDPTLVDQHCQEDANFDPTGTVWEIIPTIRKTLHRHQREAFEFIWRNVGGSTMLDELIRNDASDGGGCLIAHAPGTGKTRLAIAFLETYMRLYKGSRPVIVAPASILLTWKKEFDLWKVGVPFVSLNDKELSNEEVALASSLIDLRNIRSLDKTTTRLIKLLFWKKHESVLAISYTMLTQLAGGEGVKKRGRTSKKRTESDNLMFREMLLDLPGLMILDEGHMPRNENSYIFKTLSDVRTKKRVTLSGTPFQNNFHELYNTLCLVRPEFTETWGRNPFKATVDKSDGNKIRELKAKMVPFIHRYNGSIVHETVPGLNDNLIFLEPSLLQKKLLQEELKRSHFETTVCAALISVHPLLLRYKDSNPDFGKELKSHKWNLCDGAKVRFLMRLIELSSALEEKVLVFSEFLQPLNFVKAVLESSEHFGWREGHEILFMSGSQDMKVRKKSMDYFNKAGSEAKVMLASIKASSEGIELTGASRVVLLDVTWNPAVEQQAMCRAYRFGQERVVHVYHLIMTDQDSSRHLSQTQKTKASKYVFSQRSVVNDVLGASKPASEDMILEQLITEKVVKEAILRNASEPGLDSGF